MDIRSNVCSECIKGEMIITAEVEKEEAKLQKNKIRK